MAAAPAQPDSTDNSGSPAVGPRLPGAATDAGPVQCRFCLEEAASPASMVEPCACRGSQRYDQPHCPPTQPVLNPLPPQRFVHLRCLRGWQAVAPSGQAVECGICQQEFCYTPPPPPLLARTLTRGLECLDKAVPAALAVSAAVLLVSPSAILALLVGLALLVWLRGSSLLLLAAAMTLALVLLLRLQGIEIMLMVDASGQLRLSFVGRDLHPVSDLQPGMLLVAAPHLRNPLFSRSVVLLLQHDSRGSVGVRLNGEPWGPPQDRSQRPHPARAVLAGSRTVLTRSPRQAAAAAAAAAAASSHRPLRDILADASIPAELRPNPRHHLSELVGGPVPGWIIIHSIPSLAGTRRLWLPPRPSPAQRTNESEAGPALSDAVYFGGPTAALARALANPQAESAHQVCSSSLICPNGEPNLSQPSFSSSQIKQVLLFHGHCSWGPGQLDAEVRLQAWRYLPGSVELVLPLASTQTAAERLALPPPHKLWAHLMPQAKAFER